MMNKIINSLNFWNMSALMAENFFYKNIFLLGDAIHSMPPAGGFGMNTGIQDAHNLLHKLFLNPFCNNLEEVGKEYENERKKIIKENIKLALREYYKTLDILKYLNFNDKTYQDFDSIVKNLPIQKENQDNLSRIIISLYGHLNEYTNEKKIDNSLLIPMLFIENDVGFSYGKDEEVCGKLVPNIYITESIDDADIGKSLRNIVFEEFKRNNFVRGILKIQGKNSIILEKQIIEQKNMDLKSMIGENEFQLYIRSDGHLL